MQVLNVKKSYDAADVEFTNEIIVHIIKKKRLVPGEAAKEEQFHLESAPHIEKILGAIEENKPIDLVLPAFPAKSPSRQKTLSHLPDFGEELAFRNLNQLCERIARIYEPGAKLTVCSDGRVFADVVRIPDQDVTDYNTEMRRLAKEWKLDYIHFFDLDDVYSNVKDFPTLREELMVTYGEALESLQQRCKTEREADEMYRGITRFLFEDFSGLEEYKDLTRNAIQNLARQAAYRVIQRSNAWGRLVAKKMPDSVRLSIHPQFRVSEKIGLNLIDETDCWATPWHSVVVKQGEKIKLVPRCEAEKMNAALIFKDGRPSYFQVFE